MRTVLMGRHAALPVAERFVPGSLLARALAWVRLVSPAATPTIR
jgi:hypothetical protein